MVILRWVNKMFQNRLQQLRKERKVSQEALGEALSLHGRTIAYYESGEREPSPDTICKLADFFGVSTDYLLCRSNVRNYDELAKLVPFEELPEEGRREVLSFMEYIRYKYLRKN